MRTRGWGGDVPSTDEDAVTRILAATRRTIDERGADTGIADVARTLGVTRQTIYHYFANTDDLLAATAADAAGVFLGELAASLRGITDPGDAVTEGIALTLERLPADPYVGLMLRSQRSSAFAATVTGDTARHFGRAMLERLDVDWSTYDEQALEDVLNIVLRTIQSFILTPLDGSQAEVKRLLRIWVAPAINSTNPVTAESLPRPPTRSARRLS